VELTTKTPFTKLVLSGNGELKTIDGKTLSTKNVVFTLVVFNDVLSINSKE
jgi:hypothetical protein